MLILLIVAPSLIKLAVLNPIRFSARSFPPWTFGAFQQHNRTNLEVSCVIHQQGSRLLLMMGHSESQFKTQYPIQGRLIREGLRRQDGAGESR
jgi:hypothetical protein